MEGSGKLRVISSSSSTSSSAPKRVPAEHADTLAPAAPQRQTTPDSINGSLQPKLLSAQRCTETEMPSMDTAVVENPLTMPPHNLVEEPSFITRTQPSKYHGDEELSVSTRTHGDSTLSSRNRSSGRLSSRNAFKILKKKSSVRRRMLAKQVTR